MIIKIFFLFIVMVLDYNYKPRNIIPKMEEIIPYQTYAFSINPEPQYEDDPDRVKRIVRYIQSLLRSPNMEYKLYIESSSTGRVHGHGYIKITNPKEFIIKELYRILKHATIAIVEIEDDNLWEHYITKQAHIMQIMIARLLPVQSSELIQTKIEEYY